MAVKLVGKQHPPIRRIMTGLYSLDRAFINGNGDLGFPVGCGYEFFGLNHVGKSTFAYSLASRIATQVTGNIALCDFEGFDSTFLIKVAETNGFSGNIHIITDKEDESQLDTLMSLMYKDDYNVGILDSIGAISPIGESQGDIGEANMGQRAKAMAQLSRKAVKMFRFEKAKTLIAINHWYPKIGSYGYDTPGGEVKKYLFSTRVKLARKETFPDKSYALVGEVVKNKWGFEQNLFHVFVLAGFGLHAGMSALWDCVMLKIVKRGKTGLSVGKENLGKLGHFAKAAKLGQNEVFDQFYKLLEGYNGETEIEDSTEDGIDNTNISTSSEEDNNVGDKST